MQFAASDLLPGTLVRRTHSLDAAPAYSASKRHRITLIQPAASTAAE
jgi:hypothetical protein